MLSYSLKQENEIGMESDRSEMVKHFGLGKLWEGATWNT
jgi:hypothetical protein